MVRGTRTLLIAGENLMPHLTTDDGVRLFYQETGSGTPIVFVHEFAGDHRSWEPQVRAFSRRYRCITYNARGYPPSDVPIDGEVYSQDRVRDDIRAVLDALKIDRAHHAVDVGAWPKRDPRALAGSILGSGKT